MPDLAKEYIEILRVKNKRLTEQLKEAEQDRDEYLRRWRLAEQKLAALNEE